MKSTKTERSKQDAFHENGGIEMANNFKVIYKILKILEGAMEIEEFDKKLISYDSIGISETLWCNIMKMLVDNGYVEGIYVINVMGGRVPGIKMETPRITLKGLEYLEENSLMKKASNLAKGIIDVVK